MLKVNQNSHVQSVNAQLTNCVNFCAYKKQKPDFVSFCGQQTLSIKELDSAKTTLKKYAKERCFSEEDIQNITKILTPKNQKYITKILDIDERLRSDNLINILNYINLPDTKTEDFDYKLKTLSQLPKIYQNLCKKCDKQELTVFNAMPTLSIEPFLMTDVLLPSKKLQSIPDSCKMVFDAIHHKLDKADRETGASPLANAMIKAIIDRQATMCYFPLFLAARCLDKETFSDLWYNKSGEFDNIYRTRFPKLKKKDYETLNELTKESLQKNNDGTLCQPQLKNKLTLINLVALNRKLIDEKKISVAQKEFEPKVDETGKKIFDFEKLKEAFIEPVLMYSGLSRNQAQEYKTSYLETKKDNFKNVPKSNFWDVDFIYLLAENSSDPMKKTIQTATTDTFDDYIFDTQSPQGVANGMTKRELEYNDVDFQKWLRPTIPDGSIKLVSKNGTTQKTLTAKIWNRNPKESLFDGNYTTCCTGIDKYQGGSFVHYMLNTTFNMIEVKDENDKTVGMSRLFMAKICDMPALIVDNLEVNNNFSRHYLHNKENKLKYREMVFDYARDFAKNISTEKLSPIPVYFSGKNFKIKDIDEGLDGSSIYEDVKVIGSLPEEIYINAFGEKYNSIWQNDSTPFYLDLIDITDLPD